MYAIVDIETTGLSSAREKIIEIAILIHDGKKITKEFSTLINPEKSITGHIARMTGITNEMVQDAPKFWEIAKDIVLLTENKIFVAHNAHFDYRFVRKEFAELGYDYRREKLCTLQLSRKTIPGQKSYSLGNLCKDLGFSIAHRHRAYGDARATVMLLQYLIEKNESYKDHKKNAPFSKISLFQNLPEETGVYYFMNDQREIIYIGKSKNIKARVINHFQDTHSRRTNKMLEQIMDISFEVTGSELVALLKESYEIKIEQPVFNRKQRRASSDFGIYYDEDPLGYIRFQIKKLDESSNLLTSFNTYKKARNYLFDLCERHELCQKLCGLYKADGACFYYHVNGCRGACINEETSDSYNQRVSGVIDMLSLDHENVFILEPGRSKGEKAVVKIENSRYVGYGYIDIDMDIQDINILHDIVQPYPDNQEIYRILRNYLRTRYGYQMISF